MADEKNVYKTVDFATRVTEETNEVTLMTVGPFFTHMAEKFQDRFTYDGFTIEVSNAALVVPAADVFIEENRVVFFKTQADRLITLKKEDASVFVKNQKRFVACMTMILKDFKPESLGKMNLLSECGLQKDRSVGSLIPFVFTINHKDAQFDIFMSERFMSSLPPTLFVETDDLIIQTGTGCYLENGGFLAEGLGMHSKVLSLSKDFSGKRVSIMALDKFIGKKLCVANAKEIIDLLLQHKKEVFDKDCSGTIGFPDGFEIHY